MADSKHSTSKNSNNQGNKSSSSSGSASKTEASNSSVTKSYGGYQNFANRYGLKTYNTEDVQEANAIRDAFKEADKRS